jgi:hypothetical protein
VGGKLHYLLIAVASFSLHSEKVQMYLGRNSCGVCTTFLANCLFLKGIKAKYNGRP